MSFYHKSHQLKYFASMVNFLRSSSVTWWMDGMYPDARSSNLLAIRENLYLPAGIPESIHCNRTRSIGTLAMSSRSRWISQSTSPPDGRFWRSWSDAWNERPSPNPAWSTHRRYRFPTATRFRGAHEMSWLRWRRHDFSWDRLRRTWSIFPRLSGDWRTNRFVSFNGLVFIAHL